MRERCAHGEELAAKAAAMVLREPDLGKWDFDDKLGREKYLSLDRADYEGARDMLIDALLCCQ